MIADKAYSHKSTRRTPRARRVSLGQRGGRPPAFDIERHEQGNVVEHCLNRLKQFCGLAVHYATRAA